MMADASTTLKRAHLVIKQQFALFVDERSMTEVRLRYYDAGAVKMRRRLACVALLVFIIACSVADNITYPLAYYPGDFAKRIADTTLMRIFNNDPVSGLLDTGAIRKVSVGRH